MSKVAIAILCCALFYVSTAGAEGRFIAANGLKIYYEEYGAGEPLVLLHGGSLTSRSWQWLIPEASQHFRVFALDSRGHGKTDNPGGKFSYQLMAEDVAAFSAALGLHKPVVAGYSDGGLTALMLAMRHPQLPRAIIVGGATETMGSGERYFQGMQQFFVANSRGVITDEGMDVIAAQRKDMVDRWREWHRRDDNAEQWRTLIRNIWPMWTTPVTIENSDFRKVSMPALVLLGDNDEFFSVEDAVRLYRRLPNAELAIAPGASHTFFRDKAPLFNTLLLDFLLRLPGATEN